tara:strand:- start:8738 stop:10102 length:1365 start_codon:yes stop_codon:yes gene_type:complete
VRQFQASGGCGGPVDAFTGQHDGRIPVHWALLKKQGRLLNLQQSSARQARTIRLINRIGNALARVGYAPPELDVARLMRHAERRTGLQDWGNDFCETGLRELVAALNAQAQLSQVGRIAAYLNVLDHLCVRLRLLHYREQHPKVRSQQITQPLFIVGLPRTGTTILHELIAQDPAMRSPASWEVARPLPAPVPEHYTDDARIAATQRLLNILEWLAPGFQAIHAVGARLPQECVYLLASACMSEQFGYMYNVPAYRDWLLTQDMTPAYQWHAHFLQHLQVDCNGRQWVLKTPAHLANLGVLLAQYPDAAIVWTHRRPLAAMASFSSLATTLRAGFSDHVDPHAIGQYESQHFASVVNRGMRDRAKLDTGQFFDVSFEAVCRDPLAVVEAVYRYFNIELGSEARRCMREYLTRRPRNLYGEHRYSPEAFGLSVGLESRLFGDYRERFAGCLDFDR